MLASLRIKNLALVTDLTVTFEPGFNAITGETGAGKSIIIGALNLVLGQRADRTLVRNGCENCSVEAVFSIGKMAASLAPLLEANGLEFCEEGELFIRRTFSTTGTNRQFINGSATSLGVLSLVGEGLVDMHGPHEHQSLLRPSRQLGILDAYGNLGPARTKFETIRRERLALEEEKRGLIVDDESYARQMDVLTFQSREIEAAKLREDEEAEVEAEFHRCSNAVKLLQLGQSAIGQLSDDENSLLAQASALGRTLHELQRTDASAANLVAAHEQALGAWRELQAELSRYLEHIDVDPARLAQVEERLNLLQALKRKYGRTVGEVMAFGEEARHKLGQLEARDGEVERLDAALSKNHAALLEAGRELSAQRKKIIPKLARNVSAQLADLGFSQSRFAVDILSQDPDGAGAATGLDTVEFQFSPNVGEPTRPLRAIASSGEMSRVMLALKTVLAAEDEIPVLVFDEIDANVGGETAAVVGQKMAQIARLRQVLCITHLAPVAAGASAHYVVAKKIEEGRTVSEIQRLGREERVAELSRMLGGRGGAVRQHAEALLEGRS